MNTLANWGPQVIPCGRPSIVSIYFLPAAQRGTTVRWSTYTDMILLLLNFPVPKRYAYLSGSWKMKMAKPKVEGTPTVGSISKK